MHWTKRLLTALACLLISLTSEVAISAQEFSEWSTPVNLGPVVNSVCATGSTACNENRPAISKDGLSLYFESDRPGGCGATDIYVSQRASRDSDWEPPVNLGCTINSGANDSAPNLSTDGHTLFFHSFRSAENCGGGDIYYSHRQNQRDDFGWETPINLNRFGRDPNEPLICGAIGSVDFVNTPNTDGGPNIFNDDVAGIKILYFTRSDQPTMVGDFDIYTAALMPDGTWGLIARDNELSTTPFRDTRTAIRRRDGLEMILSSERPGIPPSSRDLWMSTRASTFDLWSTPVLVPNVNYPGQDGGPAISWDGTELFFTSARAGTAAALDLYYSIRTKLSDANH